MLRKENREKASKRARKPWTNGSGHILHVRVPSLCTAPSSLPHTRSDPVSPLGPVSDPSVSLSKGVILTRMPWVIARKVACCWVFVMFRYVCCTGQCHVR